MQQYCVNTLISSQIEVKKSNFLAFLFAASEFEQQMAFLRQEHPKARHFVYAYRLLNDSGQLVENLSDDGEPKGSSGKPTLAVLRGANLINTAVIIVRYFGGTKLGVGGLVRAYSDSVNDVIRSAKEKGILTCYISMVHLKLEVPFSLLAKVEHLLKDYHHATLARTFDQSGAFFHLQIAQDQKADFINHISQHCLGKIIE